MDPDFLAGLEKVAAELPENPYNLYCDKSVDGHYDAYVRHHIVGPQDYYRRLIFPKMTISKEWINEKYRTFYVVLPAGSLEEAYENNTQFAVEPGPLYTSKAKCPNEKFNDLGQKVTVYQLEFSHIIRK